MNIAFGTFLLFLLVIPGIAFRNTYLFGPLSRKNSRSSAFDDFVWAIIPGVIIQLTGAFIINVNCPFGYYIDFGSLGKILVGGENAVTEFNAVQVNLGAILTYNLMLIITSGILGFLLRSSIRHWHLDHRWAFLRFSNEWYYILKGETKFFWENFKDAEERKQTILERENFDTCKVHALVKAESSKSYIYSGFIHKFYLSKDGSLETILIYGAERRLLADDETDITYRIPTKTVALKNSEIINFGIDNIDLPEVIEFADLNSLSDLTVVEDLSSLTEEERTLHELEKNWKAAELEKENASNVKDEKESEKENLETGIEETKGKSEELKKLLIQKENELNNAKLALEAAAEKEKMLHKSYLLAKAEMLRKEATAL